MRPADVFGTGYSFPSLWSAGGIFFLKPSWVVGDRQMPSPEWHQPLADSASVTPS